MGSPSLCALAAAAWGPELSAEADGVARRLGESGIRLLALLLLGSDLGQLPLSL